MEENNEEEMAEVEVWEFTLDEKEIDELIGKLQELKSSKKNFEFNIDDENMLLVHHSDNIEEMEDEKDEDE